MASCRNCRYLRELWYWLDYPREKQYGYCCTVLEGECVVMQLYNINNNEGCEMFSRRKHDRESEN